MSAPLACFAALAALAAPPAAPPKRLALVVGIDAYDRGPAPEAERWSSLHGAARDARLVADELRHRGFEVLPLVDSEATKEHIVTAFREHLVARAAAGDVAVFHFSGHGQQVPDDDGDEEDGYDETLVPFDTAGIHDGSRNLRDDLLGTLLGELTAKTRNVLVVLDSCHSGTGTRGNGLRGGPPSGPPAASRRSGKDDGPLLGNSEGVGKGYVVLSASRSNQLAQEYVPHPGQTTGAFTWFLLSALASSPPRATYAQVFERARAGLLAHTVGQDPVIEGDLDAVAFSGEAGAAARFFRARLEERVARVEAGKLHGLQPGNVLALRPPGTNGQGAPLARALVRDVALTTASAELLSPSASALAALADGAEAQVLAFGAASGGARVWLDGAAKRVKGLSDAARRWPSARVVGSREDADLVLSGSTEGLSLVDAGGSAVGIPRGPDLAPLPAVPVSDPDRDALLAQAVESWWRRSLVLHAGARTSGKPLYVQLVVQKAQATVEGCPDGAIALRSVGEPVARVLDGEIVHLCDVLKLNVRNLDAARLYLAVFALSPDGSVDLLFPARGMGEAADVVLPGKEQALPNVLVMMRPVGTVTLAVIATQARTDFSSLSFAVRDVRRGGLPQGKGLSLEGDWESVGTDVVEVKVHE
ncbi:MAG: caspase family protein [Myxococcales bacterium]